ncbi:hypothetical protein [Kribbella sp. NPDC055071]
MEQVSERPIWALSDSDLLSASDRTDAAITRLLTYRVQLIAAIEERGLAQDLGASDTTELDGMW